MKTSVESRVLQRLGEFTDALKNRELIGEKFTCRRIVLKLKPKPYAPEMVKKTRDMLGASQMVFAIFLGVSVKTIQAWEQGIQPPNKMACRFMDEIQRNIEMYRTCLMDLVAAK